MSSATIYLFKLQSVWFHNHHIAILILFLYIVQP